jgi:excinuclease ABC subunit C
MEVGGIVKPSRRGRGLELTAADSERVIRPVTGSPSALEDVVLPPESEACYLLQRVRDEAHRFAITYHRKLRSKKRMTSDLEAVEGLGKAMAQRILRHFGGLRALRAASMEQLERVPGVGTTLARRLWGYLHPES